MSTHLFSSVSSRNQEIFSQRSKASIVLVGGAYVLGFPVLSLVLGCTFVGYQLSKRCKRRDSSSFLAEKLPYIQLFERVINEKGKILQGSPSHLFTVKNFYRDLGIVSKVKDPNFDNYKKDLFELLEKNKEVISIAQKILFLHGSNSATLPFLEQTGYSLRSTGDQLGEGFAPLFGELSEGMSAAGVNQKFISGETIRGIYRCWECYAKNTKYIFNPQQFEKPEEVFLQEIQLLEKCTPQDTQWDYSIIKLLRLKQWNPKAFNELAKIHSTRLNKIKERAEMERFPKEECILRAMDFNLDRLKEGPKDLEKELEILYEIGLPRTIGVGTIGTPMCGGDTYFRSGSIPEARSFFGSHRKALHKFFEEEWFRIVMSIVELRMAGKFDKPFKLNRPINGQEFVIPREFITQEIHKRISSGRSGVKRRFATFNQLFFSDLPKVDLSSKRDRDLVCHPFPILYASTQKKPLFHGSEFVMESGIKLGKEIDLIFVPEKNKEFMENWVFQRGLKVKVFGENLLNQMRKLPLTHTPDQIERSLF